MAQVTPPTPMERIFNKLVGVGLALGLGPAHMFVLHVRGRKTGRVYSTPVDVLVLGGRRYLVAPRGHTSWARNALATGSVTLSRGRRREECRVRALAPDETAPVLKAYLDAFRLAVQRYFPVPAGSPEAAFVPLADRYPVFELSPR
jgi:deazaflavin-dependent oxidoreductase (nitroreductase family)